MDISMLGYSFRNVKVYFNGTLVGVTCGILSFMGWYMDKKI